MVIVDKQKKRLGWGECGVGDMDPFSNPNTARNNIDEDETEGETYL